MRINTEQVEALIRDCAVRLILPRFKLLADHEIESKSGPNDLVTIADRETEIALEASLTQAYPGSVLIGEEGIAAGLTSTAILQEKNGVVWVADPVDGTWNFVHGKPEFAVMLACVIDGETRHGWIYDVPADRMLYAEKGAGTYLDGARQHVAAPKPLAEVAGFCASRYFPKEKRALIKDFSSRVKGLHVFGCAGHEYMNVACGIYDFALYTRGRPWDHLPGMLAVQEAGGVAVHFDGTRYAPQDDFSMLAAVSNAGLLDDLRAAMLDALQADFSTPKS